MQTDLLFPQSLAEKYRPVRIADFIGLERPKRILSAFCKRPASGAWLFVGSSGVGKMHDGDGSGHRVNSRIAQDS